jgi:hypothetical protein
MARVNHRKPRGFGVRIPAHRKCPKCQEPIIGRDGVYRDGGVVVRMERYSSTSPQRRVAYHPKCSKLIDREEKAAQRKVERAALRAIEREQAEQAVAAPPVRFATPKVTQEILLELLQTSEERENRLVAIAEQALSEVDEERAFRQKLQPFLDVPASRGVGQNVVGDAKRREAFAKHQERYLQERLGWNPESDAAGDGIGDDG